jgi:hypothetical protein
MGQMASVPVDLAHRALRYLRRAAPLVALAAVSGCSNLDFDAEFRPAAGPDPSYRVLAADRMKATFKDYRSYTAFEISEARWVHSVNGWGWIACVRYQDQGHRRAYAIFFKDRAIVDARFAVQTDACDALAYAPADLGTGGSPVAGIGQLSPLY